MKSNETQCFLMMIKRMVKRMIDIDQPSSSRVSDVFRQVQHWALSVTNLGHRNDAILPKLVTREVGKAKLTAGILGHLGTGPTGPTGEWKRACNVKAGWSNDNKPPNKPPRTTVSDCDGGVPQYTPMIPVFIQLLAEGSRRSRTEARGLHKRVI